MAEPPKCPTSHCPDKGTPMSPADPCPSPKPRPPRLMTADGLTRGQRTPGESGQGDGKQSRWQLGSVGPTGESGEVWAAGRRAA